MNDYLMDAFKDDKTDAVLFGDNIYEANSHHEFSATREIPESKCNNVSFMKVEELPENLRNLLAVSESFICYSVTTKKNLLRLINTITGDKVILRGHEAAIIDLKFSPSDNGVLCSIDRGLEATSPHIFFWKKEESSGLDFQCTAQLNLSATFLQPHPSRSDVWLFADSFNVALYSTLNKSAAATLPVSYADLPAHLSFGSSQIVKDVAFVVNGNAVAVALAASDSSADVTIQICAAGNGASSLKVSSSINDGPVLKNFLCMKYVGGYLVTVCKGKSPVQDKLAYELSVWDCDSSSNYCQKVQTVHVELPRFRSNLIKSATANASLEVSLSSDGTSGSKYLVIASRYGLLS